MNSFFQSVFISERSVNIDIQHSYSGQFLSDIVLSASDVQEVLSNLNPNKACEPDNIPGRLLKIQPLQYHPACVVCLICLFAQGSVPAIRKKAKIAPIDKGNDPSLPVNYRQISLFAYR